MKANTESLNRDLKKSLADLRQLGSDIREDVRAAGVDARAQWKRFLEPQLTNMEKLVKEVGHASHATVVRTAAAFDEFKTSLKKSPAPTRGIRTAKRAKPIR